MSCISLHKLVYLSLFSSVKTKSNSGLALSASFICVIFLHTARLSFSSPFHLMGILPMLEDHVPVVISLVAPTYCDLCSF